MIRLESVAGEGTVFDVLLPVAGACLQVARSSMVANQRMESAPAKRTVLIVEDEPMLRSSVSKVLRKEGLNVIEADDGVTAVDLFRRHEKEIDVILLDLTIPGTTSTAVVEEAVRLRPDIRVILTSAYGRDMAGAAANASQVRGFIRKPFRIRELVGMIQETLA